MFTTREGLSLRVIVIEMAVASFPTLEFDIKGDLNFVSGNPGVRLAWFGLSGNLSQASKSGTQGERKQYIKVSGLAREA